jgi:hypothetical protein
MEYDDDELGLRVGWDVDPDSGQRLSPTIREQLRKSLVRTKENDALKAELDGLKKTQALQRAGVPNDARGDVFSKTYDGPNDPDSVRVAFEALFGKVDESVNGSATGNASAGGDAAATRVVNAGATGAGTGGTSGDVDLATGMTHVWEEAAAKGGASAGNRALKVFLEQNKEVTFDYDGRTVGIKNPDID